MKIKNFAQCLKEGQEWESEIESWMDRYFSTKMPGWAVEYSKDVHRDEDNDQFPDYTIYSITNPNKYCFLDAKKRIVLYHTGHDPSFGFDRKLYQSYTNIAKKRNTKVFIAFRDKNFDKDHLYLLNMNQPADFIWNYGKNGHGEPICYRWYVDNLKKMRIS